MGMKSGPRLLLNRSLILAYFAAGHVIFTTLGQQGRPPTRPWEQAQRDGLTKFTSKLIIWYSVFHKNSNCVPYQKMIKYALSLIENASQKCKRGVKKRKITHENVSYHTHTHTHTHTQRTMTTPRVGPTFEESREIQM